MSQSESLFERARKAIEKSFTLAQLDRLVYTLLGEDLEVTTKATNKREQVSDLLRRAEREGWAQELLDALAAERPKLAALAQELRDGAPLTTPPVPLTPGAPAGSPRGGPVLLDRPSRVQPFIGREDELARLLDDLWPGKVITLCGPAGVGKTALAAEAVWRLAPGDKPPDRFPDGIISHTFYHQPQAGQALEKIARAYGIAPLPTPRDAAQLALAGRKVLIVLDGAEAADDLPAVLAVAGTCGVLITTQRRSDAPAAMQDVAPLPRPQSLQLLRELAGGYADDDTAANEIVRLLGGLPLALFLVGHYLSSGKQAAGEYVPWLKQAGLEALRFGDRPSKSVPLLIERSLERVSDAAREAFGVVGVLELAPFDADAVNAGLDLDAGAAHRFLAELVNYGLLLRLDGRYQVTHALAHAYAHTRAAPSDATIEYLALFYADRAKACSEQGSTGLAALDRDRAHIIAVQAEALQKEKWQAVQQITLRTKKYLDDCGYATDRVTILEAGLNAASALGNRDIEGQLLAELPAAYFALGDISRTIELSEQRLDAAIETNDRRAECAALATLGWAYAAKGEARRAIKHFRRCLKIARARNSRDHGRECIALGGMGLAYAGLGDLARAIKYHEQHLQIARKRNDRREQGNALDNLGAAYRSLGQTHRAIDLYEQVQAILLDIGDRKEEGNVLGNLGNAYADLGETRRAIGFFEQALVILRETGNRQLEATHSWDLGVAYEKEDDLARAVAHMEVCVAYLQKIGHPDAARRWARLADLKMRAGM